MPRSMNNLTSCREAGLGILNTVSNLINALCPHFFQEGFCPETSRKLKCGRKLTQSNTFNRENSIWWGKCSTRFVCFSLFEASGVVFSSVKVTSVLWNCQMLTYIHIWGNTYANTHILYKGKFKGQKRKITFLFCKDCCRSCESRLWWLLLCLTFCAGLCALPAWKMSDLIWQAKSIWSRSPLRHF